MHGCYLCKGAWRSQCVGLKYSIASDNMKPALACPHEHIRSVKDQLDPKLGQETHRPQSSRLSSLSVEASSMQPSSRLSFELRRRR